MEDIVEKICVHFQVSPQTIAKKRHGSSPELTYGEVLLRLLSGTGSLTRDFPEFCKESTSKFLKAALPGKTKVSQSWRTFILSSVGLKRCSSCEQIKTTSEFSSNKKEPDGLRAQCRVCSGAAWSEHYSNNAEHHRQRSKDYYAAHSEDRREYSRYFYHANIDYYNAMSAKRRAQELNACSPWADIDELDRIYANRPDGYHVDHIVPLQGQVVCGLHVENNLQYLPAKDNLAKSNSFDPDTHQHRVQYVPPY